MSAVCDYCDQEMLTGDGCTHGYVHAFRYGYEPRVGVPDLEYVIVDTPQGRVRGVTQHQWPPRCWDCGTKLRFDHHPGCLAARCLLCGDQIACCEHGEELWCGIRPGLANSCSRNSSRTRP